jgi:chromatin segregation and condensation protein Rec8/ScpA/Scc1 (kleisin family)
LSTAVNRTEIAVTLLAVLELIKRREIVAVQSTMFGPIAIQSFTAVLPATAVE